MRVQVWLERSDRPITIENPGLIGTTTRVQETYGQLARRTYDIRLRRYSQQFEQDGYFEYDRARFFSNGDIVVGTTRVNVYSSEISVEPFQILIVERDGDPNSVLALSTEIDADVFVGLLKVLFGRSVERGATGNGDYYEKDR